MVLDDLLQAHIVATIRDRLERLKANPKNCRASEVVSLLEAIGVRLRKKPGSHHVYSYPGMYPLTLPYHNPHHLLKEYAAKEAFQWIEEVLERQEQQEDAS